jgi:hypothetical protein
MPIGNPGNPREAQAGGGREAKGDSAVPVAAYEVTKMPLPQGRCVGKYTEEAKQAAIEGTVVLDLVVGADSRVREVRVVSGLGHGLTEASIAAAKGVGSAAVKKAMSPFQYASENSKSGSCLRTTSGIRFEAPAWSSCVGADRDQIEATAFQPSMGPTSRGTLRHRWDRDGRK